jgi:hypothetical protein
MNRRQVFGGLAGAALAAALPETAEGVGRRALSPAVGCDPALPGRGDVILDTCGGRFVFRIRDGRLLVFKPPSGSPSRSGVTE